MYLPVLTPKRPHKPEQTNKHQRTTTSPNSLPTTQPVPRRVFGSALSGLVPSETSHSGEPHGACEPTACGRAGGPRREFPAEMMNKIYNPPEKPPQPCPEPLHVASIHKLLYEKTGSSPPPIFSAWFTSLIRCFSYSKVSNVLEMGPLSAAEVWECPKSLSDLS